MDEVYGVVYCWIIVVIEVVNVVDFLVYYVYDYGFEFGW